MKASALATTPEMLGRLAAIASIYQDEFLQAEPVFAPEDACSDKGVIELKFKWAEYLPELDDTTVEISIEIEQKYIVVSSYWRCQHLNYIHDAVDGGFWFDGNGEPTPTPYPDGEALERVGKKVWQLFFGDAN